MAGASNGLGTAAARSEAYGVSGSIQAVANVINQASPLVNNPSINLGSVRVGAVAPTGLVSLTNVATVAPQAALNASIATNGAPITASGSFSLLSPGATNTTSLQVGLNTATAGNFTGAGAGSATLTLVSDASNVGGCAPNCQLNLASQTVSVSGKVYSTAVAQVNTASPVNFGIVHVGDGVALKNISVTNHTGTTALGDSLVGSISASGPFSGSGTLGAGAGVAANATDATSLKVGLNTSTAGVFNAGIASLLLASHNPDMADLSLGTATVGLNAQVNNYANLNTIKLSGGGSFSRVGNVFTLDFGNVLVGSAALSASLRILNDVAGPADQADGSYCLAGAACSADTLMDFALAGFGAFTDVGAGATANNVTVGHGTTIAGLFQDDIVLSALGHNLSGYSGALAGLTLRIKANVVNQGNNVPEPGTLYLLLLAAAGMVLARRRRAGVVQ